MSRTKRAYNFLGFKARYAYSELEYHPYKQQKKHKCFYCCTKYLRMTRKEEERLVSCFESDTYYFMWNWGIEDVLEGLFGEHEAERVSKALFRPSLVNFLPLPSIQ